MMRGDRLFAIAGALSTMTMAFVLVAFLICIVLLTFGCCWLGIEFANTPIPTPSW